MRRLPHGAACTFVRPAHTEKRLSAFCDRRRTIVATGNTVGAHSFRAPLETRIETLPVCESGTIVQRSKRMQRHISPQFHM
jgi:hypothetical protein